MAAPPIEESELSAAILKLLVVWISTFTGWTLTQWASAFAIIYTVLLTYVLVRDKIIRYRRPEANQEGEKT